LQTDWDILIKVPAQGQPTAYAASTAFRKSESILPRSVRIPWQDSVVISLNRSSLPGNPKDYLLQAFLTPPGGLIPDDSLGPVRSDTLSPTRAPILLAFWNTFPAYTPVLALRRWDGAHAGPLGGRHGLQVLLSAVERSNVPVALLDLKLPESLSALDFLGAIPQVQALTDRKLLILPDALPGYPGSPVSESVPGSRLTLPASEWSRAASESRSSSVQFGLTGSPFLYIPEWDGTAASQQGNLQEDYPVIFSPLQTSQPFRWSNQGVIPLPAKISGDQATQDGLSLEVRRSLLLNAARTNPPLLILGGDLPESEWGSPEIAESAFRYITGHPWIQPLGLDDLLALRTGHASNPDFLAGPNDPSDATKTARSEIPFTPTQQVSGPLAQVVWRAYASLFASLSPNTPDLARLRAVYASQVGKLLEAANWSENRQAISTCSVDPDGDGMPECILASDRVFGLFELDGGRLELLFVRNSSGVHQIIAPSFQFITGLGDRASWDLSAGELADPATIPGAFADKVPPWEGYRPHIEPGRLSLSSPGGIITKTFTLLEDGLLVNYRSGHPLELSIPVAIDPWERYKPRWGEQYYNRPLRAGWLWGIANVAGVEIRTSAPIDFHAFTDSRNLLGEGEDPNLDYPTGHYLPFPMAIARIFGEGEFEIQIVLSSDP
jgi:hypothetical protein